MSQKKNLKIMVQPEAQVYPASQGQTLLQVLLHEGHEIDHSCYGNGTCGTCVVHLKSGHLCTRNEIEAEMASERGFLPEERLACQSEILSDCEIEIPHNEI